MSDPSESESSQPPGAADRDPSTSSGRAATEGSAQPDHGDPPNGSETDEMVRLGVIARPHGVRGEVRVHPYNQDSELIADVRTVHLVHEDGTSRRARLKKVRRAPKVWLAKFEGTNSIEEAETLRGLYVSLPRDRLPSLEEGEFYLRDTVGMSVVRDGERLGEVLEVMLYPSIECLRVQFDDGVREVPAMRPWLKRVDTEAREVRVGDLSDLPVES